MHVTPEQITAANKTNVEAALSIAAAQFAAMEKLAGLQTSALKSFFEDAMTNTRALAGAKDVQEVVNLNAAAAQPSFDKALAYSRGVYEVSSQTQSEFTKALEAQAAELNKTMVGLLDKMSKNAPAGSDVALTAVRSAMAAANQAYDSFTKVAKQATEVAEANFSAATTAAKETIKRKAK